MTDINIPGSAGTAMAVASAVSIYSATLVSDSFKIYFLLMTIVFIVATLIIEGSIMEKEIIFVKFPTDSPTANSPKFL